MSYVRSLRKILEDKNKELYGRLLNIEKKAKSLLTYTAGKFPYYTPHDFVTHSLNVEENLNWIIDDNAKETLAPYEIFFLLVAAWLHDWGMIGEKDENPKEIREIHNIRTEKYLEKLHDKVYLSQHEARIIGRICRGHTKEDLRRDYYEDMIFGSNVQTRVRFLTACLRIADECDITCNRTPEIIYYSLNPTDNAEEEFKKHLSISGVGRPVTEKHKIQLFGIAWNPKSVKVLEQVRDKMQKELNNVKLFLAQQGVVIDYIELKVDTRGFINKPIEFILDRKKIVELLIGSHLYSRKDAAVRELLQNAVDTCRLRKVLEERYVPIIKLYFDREKISVEDNGLGMNFEDASRFLSRKGSSFYVSKELEDLLSGKEFVPISKFGIGVLSCFLIASKVTIESKKYGSAACRFIIEDLAEGWRYEEGSKATEGTMITLFLTEEGKQIDVKKTLQHYAKSVEIPIWLIDEETDSSELLQQQWDEFMPEIKDIVYSSYLERSTDFLPDISRYVTMKQTILTNGIKATYFLLEKHSPYHIFDRNCLLSYRGIYIGNFEMFPTPRSRWFVLVDCTKDVLDISVSREDLIKNEKYRVFARRLYDNFLKLVETIARKGREITPYDFDCCVKYSEVLNSFLIDSRLVTNTDYKSKLILDAERGKIYPVLDSKDLKFMKGKDLFSEGDVKKIYEYVLPLAECEYHIKLVTPFLKKLIIKGELVVFNIGPHFSFHIPAENCSKSVLSIICEKKEIDFDHFDLFKTLRNLTLKKVDTPLDTLLPGNSSFVEMPEEFRGFVMLKKPYKFDFAEREHSNFFTYSCLVGKELFLQDPIIATVYNRDLEKTEVALERISEGEFLYDINDSLLNLLLENAEKIISNNVLKRLVWTYLRYLALLMSFRPLFQREWGYLLSIEKTIAVALGQAETYHPFFERMGKNSCVIEGYGSIPSERIHGWMYSG